jgi:hypothetical protein
MIIIQVMARELLHQQEALATSDEQLVESVVEIFVRGLETSN